MITKRILLALLVILMISCDSQGQRPLTFTNPLLPSGADPWSIYKDGYYYYTNTLGDRLAIWKTKSLADLKTAEQKTIWTPPAGTLYSRDIWAPELHFLGGKWYMYFAADDGNNENHRLYVLENSSSDPMTGQWVLKGKVSDPSDKWAIDGSVFEIDGQLYMIWSGWAGDVNGEQDIYIAKMKNPWTVDGERSKISQPTLDWEMHGDLGANDNPPHVNVNEGPQILIHDDKVFLVYSASGCWTDFYALGMLATTKSSNLLGPKSWTKSQQPVFKQSIQNKVFAPGHNSFFKSPDGKEDWILYHANSEQGQGCGGHRSPRAQRFTWKDGIPVFGEPVTTNQSITIPGVK